MTVWSIHDWARLSRASGLLAEVKTRRGRGALRPVAGRDEILSAARSIGVREGWKVVTIRPVAGILGYTAPLLYEHFGDKQEILPPAKSASSRRRTITSSPATRQNSARLSCDSSMLTSRRFFVAFPQAPFPMMMGQGVPFSGQGPGSRARFTSVYLALEAGTTGYAQRRRRGAAFGHGFVRKNGAARSGPPFTSRRSDEGSGWMLAPARE